MNVLLTGTYSSHNKGDLAMQLTTAGLLQERGARVTAAVPFPDTDGAVYQSVDVAVVPCNRRQLIRATWQLLRLATWRLLGGRPAWLVRDRGLDAYRQADVVVDLSGDMLTEDYGPHVAYSHYIPLMKALLLGRPLAVTAQSIGPFRWTRPLAKAILRRADVITVRDVVTQEYLEQLKLGRYPLTADIAFVMEPSDTAAVREVWGQAVGGDPRRVLGVSVSQLVAQHHRQRGEGDFYAVMAAALDGFASRHEAHIVFVPHVTGPKSSKDDRVAADQVIALMQSEAASITAELMPAEVKSVISRCDWFIGCRMHANIAALSSGLPVGAIAYSHKTPGIMQRLELGQYVLDVSDLTAPAVGELLDRVVADSDRMGATISATLPEVREAAIKNALMVEQLATRASA